MIQKEKIIPLPPADILLDILNDKKDASERILQFYESYILGIASEPVYSSDGVKMGIYIDEDLAQDIRLAVVRSLPRLRESVIKKYFCE